jgi:transcriptional regulator with XRE-family HTH domain
MNWPSIIQYLLDSGLTQAQLAELADTGQSHISGLLRGERKQPGWALGDRLLELHRERGGKADLEAA